MIFQEGQVNNAITIGDSFVLASGRKNSGLNATFKYFKAQQAPGLPPALVAGTIFSFFEKHCSYDYNELMRGYVKPLGIDSASRRKDWFDQDSSIKAQG
jgi:hypothetical protein